MNRRLLLILISALVVSSVASYVVYRIVGKQVAGRTPQGNITSVVMAARNIELGSLLTEKDVKMGDWSVTCSLISPRAILAAM